MKSTLLLLLIALVYAVGCGGAAKPVANAGPETGESMARSSAAATRTSDGKTEVMYATSGATEVGGKSKADPKPKAKPEPPKPLTVVIAADGAVSVDGQTKTSEELAVVFSDAATQKRPVTLMAAQETAHEKVMSVVELAGSHRLAIVLKVQELPAAEKKAAPAPKP